MLGTVVSNGGDAAIHDAQLGVFRATFGQGLDVVRDSAQEVTSGLFPGVHVLPNPPRRGPRLRRPFGGVVRRVDKILVRQAVGGGSHGAGSRCRRGC